MKKYIFLLSTFFLSTLIIACKGKKADETAKKTVQEEQVTAVSTIAVTEKTVIPELSFSGTVASKSEARLGFKTGGIIQKIYVKDGDVVKAGQLLATLDMTEINSQVAQANLGVEKSQRDLQRAKSLYADTVATLEQLQNATTAADLSQKTLQIAQFNQKFSEIRAVKGGTVVKKLMNEGELTGPGTPVFFLNEAGANDWYLKVGVTDRDWAALRLGDKADITFDAYTGQTNVGTITRLANYADPLTGTYEVEVSVSPKSGQRFATGLFAHAKLKTRQAQTVKIIPAESLIEANGNDGFVFVADNAGGLKKVPVRIGYVGENEIGIASGLDGIGEIISQGAAFLSENSKIKIVK